MEISELTLKLIIVLVPGMIASILFEKITIHPKWTPFKFVYNSILFGVLSYLFGHVFLVGLNIITFSYFSFLNKMSQEFYTFWENLSTREIYFGIVVWASIWAVFIALIASALDFKKVVNHFAKWLKITTKYGDESLYYNFLNSADIVEIYLRDLTQKITYHGVIDSFSENGDCNEITLNDVVVYDTESGDELYKLKFVYLCKSRHELVIEVPT